eukprot:9467615-Pyramimonas_sp.AAC.2
MRRFVTAGSSLPSHMSEHASVGSKRFSFSIRFRESVAMSKMCPKVLTGRPALGLKVAPSRLLSLHPKECTRPGEGRRVGCEVFPL